MEEYVLCVFARLRWLGEDLGSEAVSWIDERSIELGHHWFDVAHGHYHPSLPIPPPTLTNWFPSWLITLKFFWTDITHVPLVPVRDIFVNGYKVLKNPVWCGFYIMAVVIFMTHAAEFDMIHPPDVVEKYAPDPVIGALGVEFSVYETVTRPCAVTFPSQSELCRL